MNPDTFTLDGTGPAYTHAHSRDFKPVTDIAKLRQSVAGFLATQPGEVPLASIAQSLGITYRKAYAVAKWLCLRSLAIRSEETTYRIIKKTGEKVVSGKIVKIRHVVPFSSKIGPGRDASGKVLKTLW